MVKWITNENGIDSLYNHETCASLMFPYCSSEWKVLSYMSSVHLLFQVEETCRFLTNCIFNIQVPLSLGIRVASLRGTLRLYVKPPPSDQIWFGFTSMPDIDIHLNSSVGDRKISSGHLSLFLISRIKVSLKLICSII